MAPVFSLLMTRRSPAVNDFDEGSEGFGIENAEEAGEEAGADAADSFADLFANALDDDSDDGADA